MKTTGIPIMQFRKPVAQRYVWGYTNVRVGARDKAKALNQALL